MDNTQMYFFTNVFSEYVPHDNNLNMRLFK